MSKHRLISLIIFIPLSLVPDNICVELANRSTIYIATQGRHEPCPAKPCITLSQLSVNFKQYLRDNMTMILLPGKQS